MFETQKVRKRQVQEMMVSTLEQMKVPNGTGSGFRRSKCPLLASESGLLARLFFQSGRFARLFAPYGNLHVFDGLKVDLLLVVFSKTDILLVIFPKQTFCSSFTFRKRTFCSSFFSKLTFCSSLFSPYGNLHVFRGFKVDFLPLFFSITGFLLIWLAEPKRTFCSFRSPKLTFCSSIFPNWTFCSLKQWIGMEHDNTVLRGQ